MTQHTPGPWMIRDMLDEPGILVHANGRTIATLPTDQRNEYNLAFVSEEQRANARLIAAAPPLLKACVAAEKELTILRGPIHDPLLRHHLRLAIAMATAGVR